MTAAKKKTRTPTIKVNLVSEEMRIIGATYRVHRFGRRYGWIVYKGVACELMTDQDGDYYIAVWKNGLKPA